MTPDSIVFLFEFSVKIFLLKRNLMKSMSEFNLKADILIQNLMLQADGKTIVSLFERLNKTALDVIANVN